MRGHRTSIRRVVEEKKNQCGDKIQAHREEEVQIAIAL
jgi:hypothetical protein